MKKAAEISMGVEITETDLSHIQELCERVVELTEYRASLWTATTTLISTNYLAQRKTHQKF